MNRLLFLGLVLVLLVFIFWASVTVSARKEDFVPYSTCAKGPYVEDKKQYWKESDVGMCERGDTCQVQRDSKGRIEFALCVSPNIFHGSI